MCSQCCCFKDNGCTYASSETWTGSIQTLKLTVPQSNNKMCKVFQFDADQSKINWAVLLMCVLFQFCMYNNTKWPNEYVEIPVTIQHVVSDFNKVQLKKLHMLNQQRESRMCYVSWHFCWTLTGWFLGAGSLGPWSRLAPGAAAHWPPSSSCWDGRLDIVEMCGLRSSVFLGTVDGSVRPLAPGTLLWLPHF